MRKYKCRYSDKEDERFLDEIGPEKPQRTTEGNRAAATDNYGIALSAWEKQTASLQSLLCPSMKKEMDGREIGKDEIELDKQVWMETHWRLATNESYNSYPPEHRRIIATIKEPVKQGQKVLVKNWNEVGVVSNLNPKGDMVDEGDIAIKMPNGKTIIRSLSEIEPIATIKEQEKEGEKVVGEQGEAKKIIDMLWWIIPQECIPCNIKDGNHLRDRVLGMLAKKLREITAAPASNERERDDEYDRLLDQCRALRIMMGQLTNTDEYQTIEEYKTLVATTPPAPAPAESGEEIFEQYMSNTREEFINAVFNQEWDTSLRLAAGNIIICFEQMRERLASHSSREQEAVGYPLKPEPEDAHDEEPLVWSKAEFLLELETIKADMKCGHDQLTIQQRINVWADEK